MHYACFLNHETMITSITSLSEKIARTRTKKEWASTVNEEKQTWPKKKCEEKYELNKIRETYDNCLPDRLLRGERGTRINVHGWR